MKTDQVAEMEELSKLFLFLTEFVGESRMTITRPCVFLRICMFLCKLWLKKKIEKIEKVQRRFLTEHILHYSMSYNVLSDYFFDLHFPLKLLIIVQKDGFMGN